ncbi:triose-phosphate transporter family-domain-containing protein [Panaeolus papilionaceus]|nr:triose-phosphate transporter family-domain-containing protein [Panaeolus papilionaceus]
MWTLSPLSGRSYSSPFLSFSSPFRRPSRPLTSTTASQGVKSGSSSAQKPADFTPLLHLCLYFTLNLALTLYNKKILGRFPFPYTLTAVHALCGWIGTGAMVWWAGGIGGMLSAKERVVLVAFSVLYTVNIVVSNASLRLVTVPFHQVVRASSPFFTILFSALLLGKRSSRRKLLSLVPVVIGVGFATYGDYYFTPLGFFLTLLGTLLAALKTILTNVILMQTPVNPGTFTLGLIGLPSVRLPKLSLTPLHLLYLLSPLAFMQTIMLAQFTGELVDVRGWFFGTPISSLTGVVGTGGARWSLVLNGVMAFMLNVVSFNANRRVGPLGMSVAANVKQVLTILCAVSIFDLTITPANGLGIVLTLLGGVTYAYVEISERRAAAATTGKPLSTTVEQQSSNANSVTSASKDAPSNSRS